jgi:AGCS family alanine or glycine:cation symporter
MVCSATGFMLLITGKYNVQESGFGTEGCTSDFCMKEPKMLWDQGLLKVPWIVFAGLRYFVAIAFVFFALLLFWPITICRNKYLFDKEFEITNLYIC